MRPRPVPRLAAACAAVLAACLPAMADGPRVVASIAPVHSLAAAVMEGVGEPRLLVRPGASPHATALKPSDAAALQAAQVVFWVGPGLEAFLAGPLETLAPTARRVELAAAPGLVLLPVREGGDFEAHVHGADDHDAGDAHDEADHGEAHHDEAAPPDAAHGEGSHGHDAMDMHVWLDPRNARAMAAAIAIALAGADPAHAEAYRANAAALDARLAALDERLAAALAPVKAKPFVTFHDAYQYFDRRYGLAAVGAITVDPTRAPGADRIRALKARMMRLGAVCVFAEPQFEPKLVETLVEGTPIRTGVLDPDAAAGHAPGPGLYASLMEDLAASLVGCLSGAG